MTGQIQNQGRDTARHFRRLYLVALSAIAVLAIGGQLLVQHALASRRGDGNIVNKAGYQRMLSQRIALKMMLYDGTAADASSQRQALIAMRDRWLAAHRELADSVDVVAFDDTARGSLVGLFREVDQPLQRISGLVSKLVNTGTLTAAERTAVLADQELFLPLMDAVVLGLELSGQARVSFLQRVELTLLVITLLVLALEALLIFRPAVSRLQSSLDELEFRNRQATRRLESLQHLAGGIAHSFNNLLTGILGHAELERHDATLQRRSTEYIDAQIDGCRRAAEITTQLVTYSGHGTYDRKPTVLGSWLAGIAESFASVSPDIRLQFHRTEEVVAAVDRAALRQALEGIIVNAVESMQGQAGSVFIRLSQTLFTEPRLMSGPYRTELPAGLYACIQISDQGKGIAREDLERIFDPYSSSKEFGRGLGLASVLGIAHGHGGGITVDSVPGQGSTFSLFLPLTNREAKTAPAPTGQPLRRTAP